MARKSAQKWTDHSPESLQWWHHVSHDNVLGSDAKQTVIWQNSCIGNLKPKSKQNIQAQHGDNDDIVKEVKDTSSFVAKLRESAKNKDLCNGTRIHDDILKRGLVQKCSNALITMYAKCGVLAKAKELLDRYRSKDVHTWTALIAAYAQNGKGQDAVQCFKQMRHEGITPDVVTYICILKACGSIKAIDIGGHLHDEIAQKGLLGNDIVLGTALVDMYGKCGLLERAQQVLDELPLRDVVSWNALIGGYVQHGQPEQAVNSFELMQGDGCCPNAVTFICVLKAFGSKGALHKGDQVYDEVNRRGWLKDNIGLGTALVDMYVKCGALAKAQGVLEKLPVRNVISWSALIAGYAQQGHGEKALECFEKMQSEGLTPNAVTFACILKVCGSVGAADMGERVHEELARKGFLGNNVALGNALICMYAKCGAFVKANQVLQDLCRRDVVSWNTLIAGYTEQGLGEHALDCFNQMQCDGLCPDEVTLLCTLKACGSIRAHNTGIQIHSEIVRQRHLENNIVLGNALVGMYAKCGDFAKAQQTFSEIPVRDIVTWNALIAGYVEEGQDEHALDCFERMQKDCLSPDGVTYIHCLNACSSMGDYEKGKQLHDEVAKKGLLEKNIELGNAVVDMYAKCGALPKAKQVLEEIPMRDVVSWNALITGYAQEGCGEQALDCLERMRCEGLSPDELTHHGILKACGRIGAVDKAERMHVEIAGGGLLKNNTKLGNALVDMYAKCGALLKARQVLEELPARDVVSWSSLIGEYAYQCQAEQSLECFERMQCEGLTPSNIAYLCVLKACGNIGAADKGKQIHDEIARQGLLADDIVVGTALVDMYSKCGALKRAQQVLEELPVRDVVSWNALIAGYAKKGQGEQALECLTRMQQEGFSPDDATYSSILSACSLLGLLEEAQSHFGDMSMKYGLTPDLEHFTGMVVLFSRVGHLDKAAGVIQKMSSCGMGVWSALLSACRKWGDVKVGKWAFEHAVEVDKRDATAYVLMSDIYVATGMQEDAERVVAMREGNEAWQGSAQSVVVFA